MKNIRRNIFSVLTAVTMESSIIWEMILCTLKEVSRHFCKNALLAFCLSGILYDPKDGGNTFIRKDSKLLLWCHFQKDSTLHKSHTFRIMPTYFLNR